jgi:hypothetical protein
MKIGKAWACKNGRWEDNTEVTARQTRGRDNQKSRWMWMCDVELEKYVGLKRRRKKNFWQKILGIYHEGSQGQM